MVSFTLSSSFVFDSRISSNMNDSFSFSCAVKLKGLLAM